MCEEVWIEPAQDRGRRLGEGRAPHLLADLVGRGPGDEDQEPDRREEWLARLDETFPPGAGGELVQDWAGVSRKLSEPGAGEHRIETAPSRIRALGLLAAGVVDGWLPVLLVNLRSGEGWRATLICRGDRLVQW